MAKKTNPKSLRITGIESWNSKGYYEQNFSALLEEDYKIRQFINEKIGKFSIEKILIERFAEKINIIIYTARPGLIIGRRGEDVEKLAQSLKNKVVGGKKDLKIEIQEVKNPWTSAALVSKWMTEQIEKRVPYRRVLKGALARIMGQKEIQGAKVEVAGRLDGIEIARKEWLKSGKLPRQTLRADIDYAENRAFCRYGTVGVKVWIFKGEKF